MEVWDTCLCDYHSPSTIPFLLSVAVLSHSEHVLAAVTFNGVSMHADGALEILIDYLSNNKATKHDAA
jgi:hypothetical protein